MRRYQPWIGLIMVGIGGLVLLIQPQNPADRPRAVILVLAGLLYLFFAFWQRRK